ncbi:MAG: hypothetical protein IKM43_00960 [Clostridia bacterium]|nr:hypothetical protein [Clostridia bacterium]
MRFDTFKLEDITDFIGEQGLYWDGRIWCNKSFTLRQAKMEDFKYGDNVYLFLQNVDTNKPADTEVKITNLDFITYYTNPHSNVAYPNLTYSKEWRKFLLKRYQKSYAQLLLRWCDDQLRIAKEQSIVKKDKSRWPFKAKKVVQSPKVTSLLEYKQKLMDEFFPAKENDNIFGM